MPGRQLIVIGASARAAAFSAQRSDIAPYWIDQFGDDDLASGFPGKVIPFGAYPTAIPRLIDAAPEAPFIYTGAMENHLDVLEELQALRPLLGNPPELCRRVRDPQELSACFEQRGIPHPQARSATGQVEIIGEGWLLKPLRSAGGSGICHYEPGNVFDDTFYLQEHIEGESRAGVFIGNGRDAGLLGVSRQLVGEDFLHAGSFAYCGSIGPLELDDAETRQWSEIGHALCEAFGLRGLFCVDAICHPTGEIYPLEVNPRYSASVEVLELALQLPLIDMHWQACEGKLPRLDLLPGSLFAKAYLFAPEDLVTPLNIENLKGSSQLPVMTADIPAPGTLIRCGHPLMTLLMPVSGPGDAMPRLLKESKRLYDAFEVP